MKNIDIIIDNDYHYRSDTTFRDEPLRILEYFLKRMANLLKVCHFVL